MGINVYCHFPFCRRKCAYCALHSRAGSSMSERAAYARHLAEEVLSRVTDAVSTVYFGGGTPSECDLLPVLRAFREKGFARDYEFTVELNPADVFERPGLLEELAAFGVNRISMGFEALDDDTLKSMGRVHTLAMAHEAFRRAKAVIANCGFDLIASFSPAKKPQSLFGDEFKRLLEELSPVHVSVYSLIREPGTELDEKVKSGLLTLPGDDEAMDELALAAETLNAFGLERYEVSNYALKGRECRHNLAVWRGEDYLGLGEGAHGREGLLRSVGERSANGGTWHYSHTTLSVQDDALEREIFALRTKFGFNPQAVIKCRPSLAKYLASWLRELGFNAQRGLLKHDGGTYTLTARGYDVCDAIIERLLASN